VPRSARPSTSSTAERLPADLLDLGLAGYREAHARQLEIVAARQAGERRDVLVFVEHPHVITVGRRRDARANLVAPGDVEVVEVERGGDVTYHGPGQIVAYPILALGEGERDLHAFLRNLEEAVIAACADVGVPDAGRAEGKTGVWRSGRKLASIGIACRRWVTFHGLALNVTTDLSYFHRINPCGFGAEVMTSLAAETGRDDLDHAEVKGHLAAALGRTLGRRFR
jgi:lipoyl(octanoyl) transferase